MNSRSSRPTDAGTLIRAWRERLAPEDVGLDAGGRRRVQGLRREELAQLAGISVDYLIRLEQSRADHPSPLVVSALARALLLDRADRDLLFRSAGLLPPADGMINDHVPPGVHRLVSRLGPFPIGVFTAHWQLVTWTPAWRALHGDASGATAAQRNLVRAVFLDAFEVSAFRAVRSVAGRSELHRALVADLRLAVSTYPHDPAVADLVQELRTCSELFEKLWSTGAAAPHVSDTKAVEHPVVGEIVLDCDVMVVPGADLRLVVYSVASGTADAEKLELIQVTDPSPTAPLVAATDG
ncbi:helix-turn-helix transcriptional regulator [Streptomyces rubiginosohelvolus]|uniref:helix-turn-helix transcriptional regulator n=1 Tax=Streptomyces rubiginosohelvolus TaxID=67362 RepID=UPI0033AE697E